MEQEIAYVCPKCGGDMGVYVQGISSWKKDSVEVVFECMGLASTSKECDFRITVDLPFADDERILWPSQEYIYNLFQPEYEQAFVLSKTVGQYPEISGPFSYEGEALKQRNYLLYAFPETYCREFKNVLDTRAKLWVLRSSQVPRWVWGHMKKVVSEEPWADFRLQDIAAPEIREIFLIKHLKHKKV